MTKEKPFQFKFFLPDARLLNAKEINDLPADKLRAAESTGKDGLWLEIACPDRSCLDADGRITLPTQESEGKGFFLNVFCPEGSCEIVESTDVP
jgi:hypothetical protein